MDNEYDELVIGEAALLVRVVLPLEAVAEASHSHLCTFYGHAVHSGGREDETP